jgi:outer membrane lipoprotein-sorting protein
MKRSYLIFGILVLLIFSAANAVETPSGEWILKQVDKNIGSDNKISVGAMIIHGRRGSRTIKSKSWLKGTDISFTEYLAPARERGTKMLKLADELWTYSPSTDRTIKISGHMLRQSVMGSDFSYEDMMEDPELHKLYEAEVIAEETYDERLCWVLELTARDDDIAYYSRKVWVDKERFIALKEQRYARSGKLLKTTEISDVLMVQNRWVPSKMLFKDELKGGKGTEFFLESIEFNAAIPAHIFTKASLRK